MENLKPKKKECAKVESKTVKIQILSIEIRVSNVYFLGEEIYCLFIVYLLFQCQNGIGQGMTISKLNKNYA